MALPTIHRRRVEADYAPVDTLGLAQATMHDLGTQVRTLEERSGRPVSRRALLGMAGGLLSAFSAGYTADKATRVAVKAHQRT